MPPIKPLILLPDRFLKRIPLRTTLIVPFVLQILAAVGLVGYLSFRNGQQAVNQLAGQLRSEMSARVEGELKSYLDSPHGFNRDMDFALNRGSVKMPEAVSLIVYSAADFWFDARRSQSPFEYRRKLPSV